MRPVSRHRDAGQGGGGKAEKPRSRNHQQAVAEDDAGNGSKTQDAGTDIGPRALLKTASTGWRILRRDSQRSPRHSATYICRPSD